MNKFIKLPLFLGATCLVAAGLLAGVVALTDPVIEQAKTEKLSKAYQNMYSGQTVTVLQTFTPDEGTIEATGIQDIARVEHNTDVSVVYKMKSDSSYEKMLFFVGISTATDAVDSYYYLESTENSLGTGNFKNSDTVTEKYEGYTGDTTVIFSGTTVTSKAVKTAIDTALNDYRNRVWED